MNKADFIAALRNFAETKGQGIPDEYGHADYSPSRGEVTLARMLADWLTLNSAPHADYSAWIRDLPQYLIEAFSDFRTDDAWRDGRTWYQKECERDIPDLVDVEAGGIHRVLVVHSLLRLIPLLSKAPWLTQRIDAALNAQSEVIDHAWRRFVKVGYRKLLPKLKTTTHRGNAGVFGSTTLRTFEIAGRVMFSFHRGQAFVSYVGDDGDMYGNRSGAQTYGAPYYQCAAMIDDVVAHWDMDKLQRCDGLSIA